MNKMNTLVFINFLLVKLFPILIHQNFPPSKICTIRYTTIHLIPLLRSSFAVLIKLYYYFTLLKEDTTHRSKHALCITIQQTHRSNAFEIAHTLEFTLML